MSSQGGGKARDRRLHRSAPYQRSRGLLGRLGDTVSRLLPQSWVPDWLRDEEEGGEQALPQTDIGRAGPSGVTTHRQHISISSSTPANAGWDHTHTGGIAVDDLRGIQLDADSTVPVLPSPIVWPRPPLSAGPSAGLPSPAVLGCGGGAQTTSSGPPPVVPVDSAPSEQRRTPAGLELSLARKRRRRHQPEPEATEQQQQEEEAELSEDGEPPASADVSLNTSSLVGGPQPSALRNKRPRFNPSALSTSLMSQDGNTSLNRSRPGESMMYPGPTVFGGAANHRRLQLPPPTSVGPYQIRPRPVQVRAPAGDDPSDGQADLSTTARRILSVLERMSTPVADARRMALPSPGDRLLETGFSGRRRAGLYGAHGARLGRRRAAGPPVHRVVTPVKVAVEANRSLLQPEPDSDAGESPAAPTEDEAAARRVTFSAPPPAAASTGGKMRRPKERGHYSARGMDADEPPPSPLHLPDITLPLSGHIKPFSLSTSTPKVSAAATVTKRATAAPGEGFEFASPQQVVAAGLVNGLSELDTDVTFTFRAPKPVVADSKSVPANTAKSSATTAPAVSPAAAPACPPPVASSWGDKFKPAAGQWTCDTCMLSNKADAVKCVACETAKPGAGVPKPVSSGAAATVASPVSAPAANWGDKFKISPVACETPNAKADGAKKPSASVAAVPASSAALTSWGDKFKPVAGEWTCDTCMLKNKPDASKCVACETPNASAKSTPATSNVAMAPAAENWECTTCLVRNQASVSKCIACESPRPGNRTKESSPYKFGIGAASNTAVAGSTGFSFGFSGSSTSSTLTTSTPAAGFAVSSSSQLPNTGFAFGFSSGAISSAVLSPSTAAKPSSASPGVQFSGARSSAPSLKRKSSGGEKPVPELRSGSIMDVLGKGATTADNSKQSPVSDKPKMGGSLPSNGGLNLFPTSSSSNRSNESTVSAAPVFVFGSATTAAKRSSTPDKPTVSSDGGRTAEMKDAPVTGFSFGGASGAPAKSVAFTFGAATSTKSDTAATSTTTPAANSASFSFGAKTAVSADKPSAGLAFGAPSTTAAVSSSKPAAVFSFGSADSATGTKKPAAAGSFGTAATTADKPAASATFTFGSSSALKSDAPSSTFSFGNNSATAATGKPPAAVFSFGSSSSASSSSNSSKPPATTFSFGTPAPTSTASQSRPASAGFAFGAPAATTAATSTALFTFGAGSVNGPSSAATVTSSSTPTPSAGVFQFSSSASPAPAPAAPFGAPAAAASPFSFGAKSATPAATAAPAAFAFGAAATPAAPAAAPAAGVFAFGSGAAPATTSAPFSFGASAAPPSGGAFTFGAAPATPAASAGVFGAATASPAPAFGAPAAAPAGSAGFAFGAAASTPQFNFSSGQPPAAGVFQFGASSSAAPAPAPAPAPFGATAAQPANPFSATVPGGAVSGRRIRTARRRGVKK